MSPGQFDIVFCGVREGFVEESVQAHFARLFKLDANKTQRIFAAKKVTLKTNVDEPLADKYLARLAAIGVSADKLAVAPEFHLVKSKPADVFPSKVNVSRAIHYRDYGEEDVESSSMHQAVAFVYGADTRRIPFLFSANLLDYAKLWLTNMLVCLLSAGLLWPWARARTQRFFYQHTSVDGVEFGYRSHMSPVLLVQLALVIYLLGLGACVLLLPLYAPVGVLILLAALPPALHQLQALQLRNAFYGDNRWHYQASLRSAYVAFLCWPLLLVATAGLAAPWALMQIQRHIVQSRHCGAVAFTFTARWQDYLPLLPPVLLADALSLFVIYWHKLIPLPAQAAVLVLAWLLVIVRWRVLLSNLFWNATRCTLGYFVANWDLRSYQKLWLRNSLLCVLSLGLYWPWAQIHRAQYRANHLAFFANIRYIKWQRNLSDT